MTHPHRCGWLHSTRPSVPRYQRHVTRSPNAERTSPALKSPAAVIPKLLAWRLPGPPSPTSQALEGGPPHKQALVAVGPAQQTRAQAHTHLE